MPKQDSRTVGEKLIASTERKIANRERKLAGIRGDAAVAAAVVEKEIYELKELLAFYKSRSKK